MGVLERYLWYFQQADLSSLQMMTNDLMRVYTDNRTYPYGYENSYENWSGPYVLPYDDRAWWQTLQPSSEWIVEWKSV